MKGELNPRTPKWFREWRDNEFWHVAQYAKWSLWISLAILTAIIAKYILG